ncbi:MAG: hypothetical protein J7604_04045 [Sporocytophaga sp.]|uniref:bestrophin-like domain n=1 Tax=Sporocytophaga sp. TaxID=2231183 RepID=UPI001B2037A8|nr:hypothetical protein [Sporocytophaga sp.]MBO9699355.1 hypothetical protein [Sporocytophaga sp.]
MMPDDFILLTKMFLFWIGEWYIALVVLILMFAGFEAGFRMGIKSLAVNDEKRRNVVTNFQVGLISLLGLMIAFTFAMAVARFDDGRTLMAEETDALETAYFRCDLLPDSTRMKLHNVLREYIDIRLLFYQPRLDESKVLNVNRQTRKIQNRLWSYAPEITKGLPDYLAAGVLESLNHLINVSNKRYIAMENHVPELIFFLLFLISVLTNVAVGYSCGIAADRHIFFTIIFSFCVCTILLVIMDLDRPRRGLIRVSQESLIELKKDVEKKKE